MLTATHYTYAHVYVDMHIHIIYNMILDKEIKEKSLGIIVKALGPYV